MKKNCYIIIITLLVVCYMVGCEKRENDENKYEEVQNMNQEDNKGEMNNKELTPEEIHLRALDDKEYLMEVYGISSEDLEKVNIDLFSKIVDFRNSNDMNDLVKMRFDALKEKITDDNYSDIYLILSPETNKKIPQGTKVKKIGYYINPGTFAQKMVFDLENKVFYVDDYTEYKFDEDLMTIVDDYKIYEWDTYAVGEKDDNSTATYGFKLVLLGEDDHKYVYEGHGMLDLPFLDEYWKLSKKLTDITETRFLK